MVLLNNITWMNFPKCLENPVSIWNTVWSFTTPPPPQKFPIEVVFSPWTQVRAVAFPPPNLQSLPLALDWSIYYCTSM